MSCFTARFLSLAQICSCRPPRLGLEVGRRLSTRGAVLMTCSNLDQSPRSLLPPRLMFCLWCSKPLPSTPCSSSLLVSTSSSQPTLRAEGGSLEYFDQTFLKNCAGPEHWKLTKKVI